MTDTEFRHLRVLASTDVAGFVAERRALIEQMIAAAEPDRREKLWLLQEEIELMRATTPSFEQVALNLAGMISERLDALNVASARLATVAHRHCETAAEGRGAGQTKT